MQYTEHCIVHYFVMFAYVCIEAIAELDVISLIMLGPSTSLIATLLCNVHQNAVQCSALQYIEVNWSAVKCS